jgi:hypothetical protein
MSELKNAKSNSQKADFRGLTVFELGVILAIILGSVLWALSFKSGLEQRTYDAIRKGRVSTISENLKVYFLQNGSLPSEDEFNDQQKREEIFKRLLIDEGSDFLNDPENQDQLVTYAPEPAGCAPETEVICDSAAISLMLSNKKEFVRFALEPGKEAELLKEINNQESEELSEEEILKQLESELDSSQ